MCKRFVVLCNPENRRAHAFSHAFHSLAGKDLRIIPWRDFLKGSATLLSALSPESALRIESPGENFEVEKALLSLGADEEDSRFTHFTRNEITRLVFQKGRVLALRQ